jgi:hypothetical protein
MRTSIFTSFDIHPDGTRLVVWPKPIAEEGKNLHAVFLFNFAAELDRRLGGTK